MQFKNILTFVTLASAAPLLQVREEGVETVTSWEIETVTQYTTIWVAPGSIPTTSSSVVAPAAPTTAPAPPPAEPTPPVAAAAPAAPVQPSPVTAIQQPPVQPTPSVPSPPPTQAPVEAPVAAPVAAPSPAAAPAPAVAKSPATGNSFVVNILTGASSPNGPCTSSEPCSGDITHYNPSQGMGSCGPKDWASGSIYTDDDMVVAVSHTIMGSISNGGTSDSVNDLCKRSVHIKGQSGGQDVVAKVVDKCAGCSQNFALDLSPAVWAKVAPNGDGRVHDVEWYWV